ncbi:unnamed protein product [Mycena citricolor]|uniref:Uncharacterized protein n=1 Tax=Mycena citricolor TaxID=2018698 RepID=A0AAD2JZG7_9AGAR|nr:unnamed protein product [Mycena citricolor]
MPTNQPASIALQYLPSDLASMIVGPYSRKDQGRATQSAICHVCSFGPSYHAAQTSIAFLYLRHCLPHSS